MSVAAIGLIFIFTIARATTLTCRRVEPSLPATCELATSRLVWSRVKEFELQGARPKTTETDGNTNYAYPLQASSGDIYELPIGPFTSEDILASRINNFVEDPEETSLGYRYDNRVVSYIVGCFFIVFGSYLVLNYSVFCGLGGTI